MPGTSRSELVLRRSGARTLRRAGPGAAEVAPGTGCPRAQSSLMTVAGTSVEGGTSCVTTAPAPTTESAPMVTPGRIVARAAIHTFVSIMIEAAMM
jgi:hypothetical protein